ncbi:hypothetical protein [uncultured Pelagimonas sp.]|uniref:hypothetical protein n=1 Tax=uncultured Pelagimonas sp. TaxID=1618102 RepID=UPI002614B29A|nr:hypothetical protein [uncultured Pelagimonas sp.]
MRLERLGSLHQCRLSFMRVLLRRLAGEGWRFSRPKFEIDDAGVGYAVYTATGPQRSYSLVAFAHDLPDDLRSDRVIAEAWDATFALFDGVPTDADIERLKQNVPLQEAGRISERELSLSRANRSVRLWDHVVSALAKGHQPDTDMLDQVGYLMRTTAVYGSGKFGAADRETICNRPELSPPFQVEMLSVYLTRAFVRDLVQHMARIKGGSAATTLDQSIAQRLGLGNSTGLGMAPFVINHPMLFNNWIMAREEAIRRVRLIARATPDDIHLFKDRLKRSELSVSRWVSQHPIQIKKIASLTRDLDRVSGRIAQHGFHMEFPWDALMVWATSQLSMEGQELLASLILEPYPDLVDPLANCMAAAQSDVTSIDGAMTIAEMRHLLENSFGWAFDLDWQSPQNCARAWYVSEEKLEPRLGERFEEPVAPYEQPLAPARDATSAFHDLKAWPDTSNIAEFLLEHPEHRHTVRRAQLSRAAPYGEIRDNTISADVLPIDMLRAKLSFFGATHFDPRSDRWVRICMFAGAPYPDHLSKANAEDWVFPQVAQ